MLLRASARHNYAPESPGDGRMGGKTIRRVGAATRSAPLTRGNTEGVAGNGGFGRLCAPFGRPGGSSLPGVTPAANVRLTPRGWGPGGSQQGRAPRSPLHRAVPPRSFAYANCLGLNLRESSTESEPAPITMWER
ncbi:hypothetical protein GCM10010378_11620 [Streptomyces viridochromogenes]